MATRETEHLFDRIFKRLMELSDLAMIHFINGLFGADHPVDSVVGRPKTETVSENLRQLLSDTLISINGKSVYHIEAESGGQNIVVRVFEYGYAEAMRTKTASSDGQKILLKFPNARIICWEPTGRTPDEVTLALEFPDGSLHDYRVKTLKFLEHGIKELAERKLTILLPFYVLKLRKSVKSAKTKERRAELGKEMKSILDEVVETVERSAESGVMGEPDKRSVLEYTERMYRELYARYEELKEADAMLQERILTYSEEAELRGMERGMERGIERGIERGMARGMEKKAFDVARKLLTRGMALTEIAELAGLPLEDVKTLVS
jgi:hypothetical protein